MGRLQSAHLHDLIWDADQDFNDENLDQNGQEAAEKKKKAAGESIDSFVVASPEWFNDAETWAKDEARDFCDKYQGLLGKKAEYRGRTNGIASCQNTQVNFKTKFQHIIY